MNRIFLAFVTLLATVSVQAQTPDASEPRSVVETVYVVFAQGEMTFKKCLSRNSSLGAFRPPLSNALQASTQRLHFFMNYCCIHAFRLSASRRSR